MGAEWLQDETVEEGMDDRIWIDALAWANQRDRQPVEREIAV